MSAAEQLRIVSPGTPATEKKIWALGGGKGGIGKSFISTSLGITLAQLGHSVIIIDLDLGGANLHTCLGCEIPVKSLSDFISGRVKNLNDLVTETGIRHLKFISGANDALNVTNISGDQKKHLFDQIRSLPADYILVDLGAGTADYTLDAFLMADQCLVALMPEPTSIENAYRFIKAAFYRKLRMVEKEAGVKKIVDEAMDQKNNLGIRSPADLVQKVAEYDPVAGKLFREAMEQFRLQIIVNQVRTRSDVEVGYAVQSVCRRYFGIESSYVGYLDYDNAVWQSARKKRPLVLEYPYSPVVGQFFTMAKHLIDPKRHRAML